MSENSALSLRTVYSDDHSPIVHDGKVYEWHEFLDLSFTRLSPPPAKPMDIRRENALERENIYSIRGLLTRSEPDLMDIRSFGEKSLILMATNLASAGLKLIEEPIDMSGFFEVSKGWFVRPDVCARLQSRELGFLPQTVTDNYRTVGAVVNAWEEVALQLPTFFFASPAVKQYYETFVTTLRPHVS